MIVALARDTQDMRLSAALVVLGKSPQASEWSIVIDGYLCTRVNDCFGS
jgi:hypothetical protein